MRGGKERYDPDLMRAIKIDTGWRCTRCGQGHDPKTGYTLTVHHLDCNYANNELWNLAALCQRCHLHLEGFNAFWNLLYGEWEWYLSHCEPWFRGHLEFYLATRHNSGMEEVGHGVEVPHLST